MPVTAYPNLQSLMERWNPMNPAAPVIKIDGFLDIYSNKESKTNDFERI